MSLTPDSLATTAVAEQIMAYIGQTTNGTTGVALSTVFSTFSGDTPPVLDGTNLTKAIAIALARLRTHPIAPGSIRMWYAASSGIVTLDGGAAGAVTSNTGPFWYICDGTNGTPNMADRVPIGVNAAGIATVLGATGGEATHTLDINEMPSHNHTFNENISENAGSQMQDGGESGYAYVANTSSDPLSINNTGGGAAHNNLQPYVGLYFIMRSARLYYW